MACSPMVGRRGSSTKTTIDIGLYSSALPFEVPNRALLADILICKFWQEQGDEAIFAAAWELVELVEEVSHGRKPTLQRTVTTLKRI